LINLANPFQIYIIEIIDIFTKLNKHIDSLYEIYIILLLNII
jgi:hypothetical protein